MPGQLYGGAFESSYYLIRSEDAATENEIECAYWVVGLESADSAGVDIINSSLGYTTFDTPSLDYTWSTLDGNTSLASKAASMAYLKGMIVVNSAGNEGNNNSWGGRISVPGDATNILTVGSVNAQSINSGFSGKGPTFDGRVKPDIVALGSSAVTANVYTSDAVTFNSGTSFSAPILCGLVAGLWQAHPTLTAEQLMAIVRNSGTNNQNPNNEIGWGIPNFVRAHILAGAKPILTFPLEVQVFPNPSSENSISIELMQAKAVGWAEYEIVDLQGKSLLGGKLYFDNEKQMHNISLPGFSAGIYSIKLEMGGKQFLKKVVLY
jgi:hypothetical protein